MDLIDYCNYESFPEFAVPQILGSSGPHASVYSIKTNNVHKIYEYLGSN